MAQDLHLAFLGLKILMLLAQAWNGIAARSRNTAATGSELLAALTQEIANNDRWLPVVPLRAATVDDLL